MIKAWITDIRVVTALGDTLDQTWAGLFSGNTAIQTVRRFPTQNYASRVAACIPDLTPQNNRSMMHELMDRLFQNMPNLPSDTTVITATTKAGIDNLEKIQRGQSADIRDIMPASIGEYIAQRLKISNPGVNISAACASSTIAIARAASAISAGRTDIVLICCLELVTEFVFSGFSSLRALSSAPCRPFDRTRDGLSIGEGAAAIVLMHPDRARYEKRNCIGKIRGWGIAADATHITAPARDACGLIQAIRQALNKSRIEQEQIAGINAHGTGTVYNDKMELTAFQHIFGSRQIPVHSVKGAIGHTMGAAGGIEVALGVRSLSTQMLPPTIGFTEPEPGAEGRVSSEPIQISGDYLLTTNSGFAGINAAIILEK